ncbi:MAG TPA: tRNA preQ1(34) S-adenosylmethionine ribosyltransferase-isomerase QueA [Polyangiaceae bacterium]
MQTELFDYDLPESAIAVRPLPERDAARLLVLDGGNIEHARVADWADRVPEGALVVVNDTRVRRARAFARRAETGGGVELLFLEALGPLEEAPAERWRALARANRPIKVGARLTAAELDVEVLAIGEGGVLEVRALASGGVEAWLERHGHVPLPPYIRRDDELADRERYQTVFSRRTSSAAAPTAGLHLTAQALARLDARGIERATLTLDIGLGTFRPVTADDLDRHPMHSETFSVTEELARRIASARVRRAPVIAVGTTVVRALESAADPERPGEVRAVNGETRLLIQPGYRFRVVDALFTNFHQPKSTLLALVAAFVGRDAVLAAYRVALEHGYRFLSYGDAMWLPRRA